MDVGCALLEHFRRDVFENRAVAAERRSIGDTTAHGAAANHSDCFHVHEFTSILFCGSYACGGKSLAALSYRIFCCACGEIGRARNLSMLPRTLGTPGPGQSVPNNTLSAISSMRGKDSSNFCGGMPEMSMYILGWRRTRKKASFIQRGRPPWARITTRSGKSTPTSSARMGWAYTFRAPGKIEVPVWIITGMLRACARSYMALKGARPLRYSFGAKSWCEG